MDRRRGGPEREQVGDFRRLDNQKGENDFHFRFLPSLLGPTGSLTDVLWVYCDDLIVFCCTCGSVNASQAAAL